MEREIIYGVADKTGKCEFYVGFFKKEEDAIKELESQSKYLTFEYGIKNLRLEGDKVLKTENGVDSIQFAIHRFVLR
jgi:hypothetical protein